MKEGIYYLRKTTALLLVYLALSNGCTNSSNQNIDNNASSFVTEQLKNYHHLQKIKVMVVASDHFGKEVLKEQHQKDLDRLINDLAMFKPTKVVVEWVPESTQRANQNYSQFKLGNFDISQRPNEVYQIGFKLANLLNHDSIYLFDDQTEFIGSLENFSWDQFDSLATTHDQGFFDQHIEDMTLNYNFNDSLLKTLNVYDQFKLRNTVEWSELNANRMHAYEIRVGIQKSWIGPDWLGRWYRRNVRMTSNVLSFSHPNDRIIILVGDNHKWILDQLFEFTPDFQLINPIDYLN